MSGAAPKAKAKPKATNNGKGNQPPPRRSDAISAAELRRAIGETKSLGTSAQKLADAVKNRATIQRIALDGIAAPPPETVPPNSTLGRLTFDPNSEKKSNLLKVEMLVHRTAFRSDPGVWTPFSMPGSQWEDPMLVTHQFHKKRQELVEACLQSIDRERNSKFPRILRSFLLTISVQLEESVISLAVKTAQGQKYSVVFKRMSEAGVAWLFSNITVKERLTQEDIAAAKAKAKAKGKAKAKPSKNERTVNHDEDALTHIIPEIAKRVQIRGPCIECAIAEAKVPVTWDDKLKDPVVKHKTNLYVVATLHDILAGNGMITRKNALRFPEEKPIPPTSKSKKEVKHPKKDLESTDELVEGLEKDKISEQIIQRICKDFAGIKISNDPDKVSRLKHAVTDELSIIGEAADCIETLRKKVDGSASFGAKERPSPTPLPPHPMVVKPASGNHFTTQFPIPFAVEQENDSRAKHFVLACQPMFQWSEMWNAFVQYPHFAADWNQPANDDLEEYAFHDKEIRDFSCVKKSAVEAAYVYAGIRDDAATKEDDTVEVDAEPHEGEEEEAAEEDVVISSSEEERMALSRSLTKAKKPKQKDGAREVSLSGAIGAQEFRPSYMDTSYTEWGYMAPGPYAYGPGHNLPFVERGMGSGYGGHFW